MKIKGLETTIKQTIYDFKERKNYLEKSLETLNNDIISLKKDITKKTHQIKTYNEVIDNKNNRLAQLDQILKGSAKIFADQAKFTATLRDKLSKEKSATGISIEYNRHLEKDIKRLDEEKQELETRIKELENLDEDSKKLRDQELADLRQQKTELGDKHEKFIEDIRGKMEGEFSDSKLGLEIETNEERIIRNVIKLMRKFKNWENQFQNQTPQQVQEKINHLETELQKELSWWDKWINDANTNSVNQSLADYLFSQGIVSVGSPKKGKMLSNLNITYNDGAYYKEHPALTYGGHVGPNNTLIGKELVKYIYKYYRDK